MATLMRSPENVKFQDGGQIVLSKKMEEGCRTPVAITTTGNFRIHGVQNGAITVLFASKSQVELVFVE